MPRECLRCGEPAADEDRFCSSCGTPLQPLPSQPSPSETTGTHAHDLGAHDTGVSTKAPTGPAGAAFLIVRRGPNEGSSFTLDDDVISVGRDATANLFLDDVTVSRRHAEFHRAGAEWELQDCGSLNGTYVNRERIDRRQLNSGDEVQLGKYRFVFLVPGSLS